MLINVNSAIYSKRIGLIWVKFICDNKIISIKSIYLGNINKSRCKDEIKIDRSITRNQRPMQKSRPGLSQTSTESIPKLYKYIYKIRRKFGMKRHTRWYWYTTFQTKFAPN